MITFYADKIADDLDDPNLWNRFLEQHINNKDNVDPVTGVEHYTVHAQFNKALFDYIKTPIQFKTFDQYVSGKNVVVIGLHGGWSKLKLDPIRQWFVSNQYRIQAWNDVNCKIILDYCEEGIADSVMFEDLHSWILKNKLENRIVYLTSSINAKDLYLDWCHRNSTAPAFEIVWYGHFVNWLVPRKLWVKDATLENQYPNARWEIENTRYVCLNRRPWWHRILLLTLLEHYNIINFGAVSMPLEFTEAEIKWNEKEFDIIENWDCLKDSVNGYFDGLNDSFKKMYASLPRIADIEKFEVNRALDLNEKFYQNYPINLVSETLFFTNSIFPSEKVWKPMLMGQIFIVMSSPGYLDALRKLGFKTFHPYIDEEYDLMYDPVERAHAIVKSLKKIVTMNTVEFETLLKNCQPIILHNKKLITNVNKINHIMNQPLADAIENLWNN